MKFSPDILLQIYLDGSFTEEAQAEFDKLIHKDPIFAERVTQAVAERVGPVPEEQLNALESRLDARMAQVWQDHKPSPFRQALKLAGGIAALALGLTGLYLGGTHLLTLYHGMVAPGTTEGQPAQSPDLSGSPSITSPSVAKSSLSSKPSLASAKSSKAVGRVSNPASSSVRPVPVAPASGLNNQSSVTKAEKAIPSSSGVVAGNDAPVGSEVKAPSSSNPTGQPVLSNQLPAMPPLVKEPSLPMPAPGNQTQVGNALKVSVETQKTQSVVVNVLDSKGALVRRLYQGSWEPGVHQVDWDGKDETGNPVLPGDYTVIVNADGKVMSGVVTVKPNQ